MKEINILLIEDNEGDIILTTEAFEESKVPNKIEVIKDGESAICFFESIPSTENLPDIVLLDINLPRKNGHEVLHYLKSSNRFKQIPVIILTTSSSEKDVVKAYQSYANSFITKPIDIDKFYSTIQKIEDFWLDFVRLPNG